MKMRVLISCLAMLVLASVAPATILNFQIDGGNGARLDTVLTNYGDHATNTTMVDGSYTYHYDLGNGWTTNITLGYTLGSNAAQMQDYQDGSWPWVAYLLGTGGTPRSYFLTFTPDSGFGVKINSWQMFGYSSGSGGTTSWKLHQDSALGTIFDSGTGIAYGDTYANRTTFTTAGSNYMGTVVMELIQTAGGAGGYGLDNLNFDQAVAAIPEPASTALLALAGFGLLACRSRRS
jgi:hypothetical protein